MRSSSPAPTKNITCIMTLRTPAQAFRAEKSEMICVEFIGDRYHVETDWKIRRPGGQKSIPFPIEEVTCVIRVAREMCITLERSLNEKHEMATEHRRAVSDMLGKHQKLISGRTLEVRSVTIGTHEMSVS